MCGQRVLSFTILLLTAATAQAAELWSFAPPKLTPLPIVRNTSWPLSPIDSYLLAAMEKNDLHPTNPATRNALLRRVHFDLTGLPPTVDAIRRFIADKRPDAYERVVDRLLASPRFGEHWGRHWLDVARYAESSGGGRSQVFFNAWRYRDYVIRAFNSDRPFERFVREQIAGDFYARDASLDVEVRRDALIATGFLALGPKNLDNQDKELLRWDVIDEQLDTLGAVFLGMTLGCARCHDHKFDPVSANDYYALAGILASTRSLLPGIVSGFVEAPLPGNEAVSEAHRAHDEKIARLEERSEKLKDEIKQIEATAVLDDVERMSRERQALKDEIKTLRKIAPPKPPSAISVRDEDEPADSALHLRGNPHQKGETVPRGFLSAFRDDAVTRITAGESGRRELAAWIASAENPLTARVFTNRVWYHLFGRGIVRSVDNFGATGDAPSHAALLDYLAVEFRRDAGSVKRLVREIVTSRAYRLSSRADRQTVERDPENRLLSRMNRKRLDVESFRDTILLLSGRLDWEMGGPTIRPGTESEFDYEFSETRRSVYLPVFRNRLPEIFEIFDFPNSNLVSGQRTESTLPTQALYLMNSDFILDGAEVAARRFLARRPGAGIEALNALCLETLGRTPGDAERRLFDAHLGVGTDPLAGWAALFQSLFSCVDFRYLE